MHKSMAYGKFKLKLVYCTVTSIVCMFTHHTVFHQYASAKISNGSNLRAIATYRANHVVLNFNQTICSVQQLYQHIGSNLPTKDNLRKEDKSSAPKVSFIRRFHCTLSICTAKNPISIQYKQVGSSTRRTGGPFRFSKKESSKVIVRTCSSTLGRYMASLTIKGLILSKARF